MKSEAIKHAKKHRMGTTLAVMALGGVAAACFFGSNNVRARRRSARKDADETLGSVEGFGSDWKSTQSNSSRATQLEERHAGAGAEPVPPRNAF